MANRNIGNENCIFCRIVSGLIPADVVYRDEDVLVFRDIQPQASVHYLIIPTQHIDSLEDLAELEPGVAERMLLVAVSVARELGISSTGYRLVTNIGHDAGQSVNHLHFHLLGGNQLRLSLG